MDIDRTFGPVFNESSFLLPLLSLQQAIEGLKSEPNGHQLKDVCNQPLHGDKACNIQNCETCVWREFAGGEVFKGTAPSSESTIPSSGGSRDSSTVSSGGSTTDSSAQCYDDSNLLPLQAQRYFVGMGRELIEMINPVKSVCGACILFTSLEGKVMSQVFILRNSYLPQQNINLE